MIKWCLFLWLAFLTVFCEAALSDCQISPYDSRFQVLFILEGNNLIPVSIDMNLMGTKAIIWKPINLLQPQPKGCIYSAEKELPIDSKVANVGGKILGLDTKISLENGKLFVIGGERPNNVYSDQMVVLENNKSPYIIDYSAINPKRYDPIVREFENSIYLIGGKDYGNNNYYDIWKFSGNNWLTISNLKNELRDYKILDAVYVKNKGVTFILSKNSDIFVAVLDVTMQKLITLPFSTGISYDSSIGSVGSYCDNSSCKFGVLNGDKVSIMDFYSGKINNFDLPKPIYNGNLYLTNGNYHVSYSDIYLSGSLDGTTKINEIRLKSPFPSNNDSSSFDYDTSIALSKSPTLTNNFVTMPIKQGTFIGSEGPINLLGSVYVSTETIQNYTQDVYVNFKASMNIKYANYPFDIMFNPIQSPYHDNRLVISGEIKNHNIGNSVIIFKQGDDTFKGFSSNDIKNIALLHNPNIKVEDNLMFDKLPYMDISPGYAYTDIDKNTGKFTIYTQLDPGHTRLHLLVIGVDSSEKLIKIMRGNIIYGAGGEKPFIQGLKKEFLDKKYEQVYISSTGEKPITGDFNVYYSSNYADIYVPDFATRQDSYNNYAGKTVQILGNGIVDNSFISVKFGSSGYFLDIISNQKQFNGGAFNAISKQDVFNGQDSGGSYNLHLQYTDAKGNTIGSPPLKIKTDVYAPRIVFNHQLTNGVLETSADSPFISGTYKVNTRLQYTINGGYDLKEILTDKSGNFIININLDNQAQLEFFEDKNDYFYKAGELQVNKISSNKIEIVAPVTGKTYLSRVIPIYCNIKSGTTVNVSIGELKGDILKNVTKQVSVVGKPCLIFSPELKYKSDSPTDILVTIAGESSLLTYIPPKNDKIFNPYKDDLMLNTYNSDVILSPGILGLMYSFSKIKVYDDITANISRGSRIIRAENGETELLSSNDTIDLRPGDMVYAPKNGNSILFNSNNNIRVTNMGKISYLCGSSCNINKDNDDYFSYNFNQDLSPSIIFPYQGAKLASNQKMNIVGLANPGSRIKIMLNDILIGTTISSKNGLFKYTSSTPLQEGLTYELSAIDTSNFGNSSDKILLSAGSDGVIFGFDNIAIGEYYNNRAIDNLNNQKKYEYK